MMDGDSCFIAENYPFQPPPSNPPSVFSYQQPPQQQAYSQYGQPTAVTSTDQPWDEKNNGVQQQAPAQVDHDATTQLQNFRKDKDDLMDEQLKERVRKAVEEQLKPHVEGLEQSRGISKKLEEGYTLRDIPGEYNGGSYLASNNDSGSILTVSLGGSVPLIAKPGMPLHFGSKLQC